MRRAPTRPTIRRSVISALTLGLFASMAIAGVPPDVADDQAQRDACHAKAEAYHDRAKAAAERAREARHAATAAEHDARAAEREAEDAQLAADLAREAWEASGDPDDLTAYKVAVREAKRAHHVARSAALRALKLDRQATSLERRAEFYKQLAKDARHRCAPGQVKKNA